MFRRRITAEEGRKRRRLCPGGSGWRRGLDKEGTAAAAAAEEEEEEEEEENEAVFTRE